MHELNRARAEVGVPPLIWNVSLEAYARNNANKRVSDCKLVYFHGPYGECIAKSYGGGNSADAVRLWIAERVFYNHESNNCSSECRSYTQVVWRNTKYLGCATAQCYNGWTFVTCSFDPPGNQKGQSPY
ncbi:pathogenesis-related protein 1-like [Alnus glutinosa]|uniref:pathogenesis-related protein 1-like n=1 Tax=Alnus glutinosa TaxID=3517 RepID=UPI002D784763|nr:pathogenesis-related protein 1-like [Alnus glutinosa]